MTAAEVVERVQISQVAEALGIRLDRTRRRGVAMWRNGKQFSVAFNDAKGVFFDFVTNEGGGKVDFVSLVLNCGRKEAFRCLVAYSGVPVADQTNTERREWSRRMHSAEPEARRLVMWKVAKLEDLREESGHLLHIYHRAKQFILTHDFDECEERGDLRFELALGIEWNYWSRIRELERNIDWLETATYSDLLARFRTGAGT